jgi:hypothetical protein
LKLGGLYLETQLVLYKNKKLMRKVLPPIILFCVFCILVYNSGTEYYEKSREFHKNYFSGEILKIKEGRGTKIYYESDKYFYEGDFEGIKLKVGDIIRKNDTVVIVMRRNSRGEYVEVGIGRSKEPKKSYFNYFFGI